MRCIRCQHQRDIHKGDGQCAKAWLLEYSFYRCTCRKFVAAIPTTRMPTIISYKEKRTILRQKSNGDWEREVITGP